MSRCSCVIHDLSGNERSNTLLSTEVVYARTGPPLANLLYRSSGSLRVTARPREPTPSSRRCTPIVGRGALLPRVRVHAQGDGIL